MAKRERDPCARCGRYYAAKGTVLCRVCREDASERAKRFWQRKKESSKGRNKTCLRCNKRKVAPESVSRCAECLEYARKHAQNSRK